MTSIAFGRDEYNLTPYFLAPLPTVSAVEYRHQVLRDLEDQDVRSAVGGYAHDLSQMRKYLALIGKLHYRYQRERWFLDAVDIYCRATKSFAERMSQPGIRSRGFTGFREYLNGYVAAADFTRLAAEARELLARLAEVRYCIVTHLFDLAHSFHAERRFRRCSCGPSGATTGSGHSGCLRASPCRPATGPTSTGRYSAPSPQPRPARGRARNHPRATGQAGGAGEGKAATRRVAGRGAPKQQWAPGDEARHNRVASAALMASTPVRACVPSGCRRQE